MNHVLRRSLRLLALSVLPLWAFSACVDTSPDYYAKDMRDAGGLDATSPTVDAALLAECRECVNGDACAAQVATCNADPKCKAFLACVLDLYCIDFRLGDLAHLPKWLGTCGQQTGVLSQTDPAILAYVPVLLCGQDPTKCGSVCAPTHEP